MKKDDLQRLLEQYDADIEAQQKAAKPKGFFARLFSSKKATPLKTENSSLIRALRTQLQKTEAEIDDNLIKQYINIYKKEINSSQTGSPLGNLFTKCKDNIQQAAATLQTEKTTADSNSLIGASADLENKLRQTQTKEEGTAGLRTLSQDEKDVLNDEKSSLNTYVDRRIRVGNLLIVAGIIDNIFPAESCPLQRAAVYSASKSMEANQFGAFAAALTKLHASNNRSTQPIVLSENVVRCLAGSKQPKVTADIFMEFPEFATDDDVILKLETTKMDQETLLNALKILKAKEIDPIDSNIVSALIGSPNPEALAKIIVAFPAVATDPQNVTFLNESTSEFLEKLAKELERLHKAQVDQLLEALQNDTSRPLVEKQSALLSPQMLLNLRQCQNLPALIDILCKVPALAGNQDIMDVLVKSALNTSELANALVIISHSDNKTLRSKAVVAALCDCNTPIKLAEILVSHPQFLDSHEIMGFLTAPDTNLQDISEASLAALALLQSHPALVGNGAVLEAISTGSDPENLARIFIKAPITASSPDLMNFLKNHGNPSALLTALDAWNSRADLIGNQDNLDRLCRAENPELFAQAFASFKQESLSKAMIDIIQKADNGNHFAVFANTVTALNKENSPLASSTTVLQALHDCGDNATHLAGILSSFKGIEFDLIERLAEKLATAPDALQNLSVLLGELNESKVNIKFILDILLQDGDISDNIRIANALSVDEARGIQAKMKDASPEQTAKALKICAELSDGGVRLTDEILEIFANKVCVATESTPLSFDGFEQSDKQQSALEGLRDVFIDLSNIQELYKEGEQLNPLITQVLKSQRPLDLLTALKRLSVAGVTLPQGLTDDQMIACGQAIKTNPNYNMLLLFSAFEALNKQKELSFLRDEIDLIAKATDPGALAATLAVLKRENVALSLDLLAKLRSDRDPASLISMYARLMEGIEKTDPSLNAALFLALQKAKPGPQRDALQDALIAACEAGLIVAQPGKDGQQRMQTSLIDALAKDADPVSLMKAINTALQTTEPARKSIVLFEKDKDLLQRCVRTPVAQRQEMALGEAWKLLRNSIIQEATDSYDKNKEQQSNGTFGWVRQAIGSKENPSITQLKELSFDDSAPILDAAAIRAQAQQIVDCFPAGRTGNVSKKVETTLNEQIKSFLVTSVPETTTHATASPAAGHAGLSSTAQMTRAMPTPTTRAPSPSPSTASSGYSGSPPPSPEPLRKENSAKHPVISSPTELVRPLPITPQVVRPSSPRPGNH